MGCGLNAHHGCIKQIPHTCGEGTRGEPRGRIKLTFSSVKMADPYWKIYIIGELSYGQSVCVCVCV